MIAQIPARTLRRLMMIVLLPLLVSSCMLARTGDPASIISPQTEIVADADWPVIDSTLLVSRPQSDQLRNSDRILVRVAGSRLQAWPAATWYDSMPDMTQTLLIRTLEDAGKVRGVSRPGSLRATYNLMSELRHFEVVDDGEPDLTVELSLQATLVHHASGDVLATSLFSHEHRADGRDLDAVIAAFERGLEELVPAVVGWVLEQVRMSEAGQD